jgi:hypothetical protein
MKLVGERRAVAAVIFAFWFLLYLLNALSGVQPALAPALYALAGVYFLAFFSLVAGYFWARWYAVGVGLFGVITGAVGLWQIGPDEIILIIGGSHLLATLLLWGSTMSEGYDGQPAWREKFQMDDSAVQRLGRAVIRAGVSLPFVLLYALAPKPDGGSLAMTVALVALTGLGLRGLVRLRTWGVLALGAAGGLMLASATGQALAHHELFALRRALAGVLLISVAVPFAGPMVRLLARAA